MSKENLNRVAALILNEREQLLANWRREVRRLPGAEKLDTPTINDQVPELLDHLAKALTSAPQGAEAHVEAISTEHGLLRWQAGFDVTEVISEYNILRQCLQNEAESGGITLRGKPLLIVNNIFD